MTRHPPSEGVRELVERLWTERHLLESLLFKLVTAKLILAADARRFLAPALAEVEQVIDQIRAAELRRGIAVARLAEEWGMRQEDLTLGYLVEHAPEPAASIFADHREGFLRLTREIEEVAAENRLMASAALDHIRDNIDALMGGEMGPTYGPTGHRETAPTPPRRLDQVV